MPQHETRKDDSALTLPDRAKFAGHTSQKDLGEVLMQEIGEFLYIVQGNQSVRLTKDDLFRNTWRIEKFQDKHHNK